MRYADTLLIEGEEVALRTRQHWLALVIAARYGFGLWLIALLLLGAAAFFNLSGSGAELIGYVVLGLFALGLVIVLVRYWQWWAQDYMITNRRLMKVWGVLNKRSVDSSLEKINDARLDQSLFGRLLGYGHLEILTAAEESDLDDYDMIRDPKGFKKIMLTQKHGLESGYGYRGAPSPPLRAAMDMNGEPARRTDEDTAAEAAQVARAAPAAPSSTAKQAAAEAPAASMAAAPASAAPATAVTSAAPAAAVSSPAPVAPADRALEVTQTLARLADLRDRGAISEEEFQAKKQQLLDRL